MSGLAMDMAISPARMTPNLTISDACAAHWFGQVTLRLRREMAWCWHQRAGQPDPGTGVLPPLADAAAENLDMVRYEYQKHVFFRSDPAACYLGEQIAALGAIPDGQPYSRWQWVAESLNLDQAAQFVLALGLAARMDAGLAPLFATCLNDLTRPFPTLALAQRLWDDPLSIIDCADPDHPIYRFGLLALMSDGTHTPAWQRPLDMPAMVARQFVDPETSLPRGAELLSTYHPRRLDRSARLLAARLQADVGKHMQIVPLVGPRDTAFRDWAATLGEHLNRPVVAVDTYMKGKADNLLAFACVCWLKGLDAMLPEEWIETENRDDQQDRLASAKAIPLRWYVPVNEQDQVQSLPHSLCTPPLKIKGMSYSKRVRKFKQGLGGEAENVAAAIEECARRYRMEEQMVERVTGTFADPAVALTADALALACANEVSIELGNLAQRVVPRFGIGELILPAAQARQFQEILHAMETLTTVHYHWGTAKVWNESGLSALFGGPPGTGKTMAAEVLADALNLPMYRIDLSQVVNKYIGETEKNLKRIFDVAELGDCILFFDEADALFGKRTEVRDAHDRFANIEISYLLERMERFRGLAILATNRRKDLDEAFMRRLRFVIEFPDPGVGERQQIWEDIFPAGVDVSDLDFPYLAKQFQLTGGHIRSIAFNACLRAADARRPGTGAKVGMPDLLVAVKRELEKMKRSASDELFGAYSDMIRESVT